MQTSCALGGGGNLKAFLRKWHVKYVWRARRKKGNKKNGSLSKQTDSKMAEEREPHHMGPEAG